MLHFFRKSSWIITVILVLLQVQAFAQPQDNPINKIAISSPTAASLGKYGDIPVNYHTGIPQISIPVHTVTSGPLSVSVSLSYHASGLKVQEPSSWVGAGWSLNAGGVITRSVMGLPDERGTNNAGVNEKGHFSDYGYNSYYAGVVPEDWIPFADGRKDGEPDLFFFNFGGASGKFYFRDDRTPVIVPEADFKIEPSYSGVSNTSIQSFIITAADGTKYYFGNSPGITGTAPVEITKPSTFANGLSSANVISSWYLNKISSADDKFSITLNYQAENYGYHTISMFPIDGVPTGGSGSSFGSTHGYDLVKNIVQGVRLSQIVSPNGTVNFIEASGAREDLSDVTWSPAYDAVNTTAKPLGSIQITDGSTVLKKFDLTYSYFTDNSTPLATDIQNFTPNGLFTDKKRLRLDQVKELSEDGTVTKPPYYFTYFGEQVPRRLSFGIDHWGFINGANSNQTPIPTYTVIGTGTTQVVAGADRDANWPAMRGGSLQQINYPTGGYSVFEFEPHNVYNTNTSMANVTLANLYVHLYSQATYTMSSSFTIGENNPISMSFNNTSNYGGTFIITNSSSAVVYNTPLGNNQTFQYTIASLPNDTYTATLSLPNYSNLTGGATATLTQLQTVQTTNTVTIGGLRIKNITHNDGVTPSNIVTNYAYTQDNPTLSSAILYSRPQYVSIIRNDIIQEVGYLNASGAIVPNPFGPYGCISGPDATFYKSPSSIRPMATTQGNHLGYSQVKVSQTGNGYSVYKYYGATGVPPWLANPGDIAVQTVDKRGCNGNAPNFPAAPLPFDYMRGELKYDAQYNEAGQLLRESTYTPTYQESTVRTPAFITVRSGPSAQILATKYNIGTAFKVSDAVVRKEYDPVTGVYQTTGSTTYYESPYHHQPTKAISTNSKGETVESRQKYVNDFRITACDNIADGYPQYTADCSSCLTTYINAKLGCGNGSPNQCLGNAYLAYQQCLSNARINYINYRRTNFTDPTNTWQTNHNTTKANALSDLKPILQLQDDYQNSVIEATKWKNGNLLGSSFSVFDFNTVNPAGKVYLNKVQSINIAVPSATFTYAATNGANTGVTKDSRYADETSAKFYDGNLAEITGKDGVTTAYLWGYNNTLPIAKSIGVNHATLLNAYNAVGGNLASLRTHTSLASAQLNTYEYTPAIGMVKETDVNGKHISYEYDKLQRLLLARDFNNNIVKQYDYKYQALPVNEGPQWIATSNTRCKPCPQNNTYISNILQQEEKDNNPNSATYNSLRWTDIGTSTACVSNADWQNTSAPLQCKKNLFNQNTGWQMQEQMDMNPCSSTYGQIQWITTVYNPTACPPPVCNTGNCSGNDKKCINNVCETGNKIYTSSIYNRYTGLWTCTYHYHWSDGSDSPDYTETSTTPCNVTD